MPGRQFGDKDCQDFELMHPLEQARQVFRDTVKQAAGGSEGAGFMQRGYSRAFSLIFQVFFAVWGTLGVAGMAWLVAIRNRRVDPPDPNLVVIFAILFAAIIASAVAGVVHMRRKDSEIIDGTGTIVGVNNTLAGAGVLAFMTGHMLFSYAHALRSDRWSYLEIGAIIFGLFQALYGTGQLGWGRRRRRVEAASTCSGRRPGTE